ncbi:MAG: UvrB/UvrC motif-containing protein [Gemmatimonadaceae bacterium]|nr:UvrB/UvrC motif-containing protein [Gemmatimonadaceae bacterium]
MLCGQCGERDAMVHLTQIVENAVTQLHLCEKCAAEKGIETTITMPASPLGEFLQAVQSQAPEPAGDLARCEFCGTTIKDFRASGRLGCAHCYQAFDKSLRELLRRVHGSATHVGRSYTAPVLLDRTRDATLEGLKAELRAAVAHEEFEVAATLRDKIRGMEG